MNFRRDKMFHRLIFIWLLIRNLEYSHGQIPGIVFPGGKSDYNQLFLAFDLR